MERAGPWGKGALPTARAGRTSARALPTVVWAPPTEPLCCLGGVALPTGAPWRGALRPRGGLRLSCRSETGLKARDLDPVRTGPGRMPPLGRDGRPAAPLGQAIHQVRKGTPDWSCTPFPLRAASSSADCASRSRGPPFRASHSPTCRPKAHLFGTPHRPIGPTKPQAGWPQARGETSPRGRPARSSDPPQPRAPPPQAEPHQTPSRLAAGQRRDKLSRATSPLLFAPRSARSTEAA